MPPFSLSVLGKTRMAVPSLLDAPLLTVTAGRAAISLALQHAGIKAGDEVLAPAYHCESMIAPIDFVGATRVFYTINADTSVNIDDIRSKITAATRGLIVTHYFGFPQTAILQLRELCDQHGITLIEDCAHALLGTVHADVALGSVGDYAIGSPMKFFPLFDGGLLVSARHDLRDVRLRPAPWSLEVKALIDIITDSIEYGRMPLVAPVLKLLLKTSDVVWGFTKRLLYKNQPKIYAPASSEGGYGLDPDWIDVAMSRVSRLILMHCRLDHAATARRENYRFLEQELNGFAGMKSLFPTLTPGVVPLVYPVTIASPETAFPKLKLAGVPIWRFGEYLYPEITPDYCPNSVSLSRCVFQFPCHSELTPRERQWMVDTIRSTLTN